MSSRRSNIDIDYRIRQQVTIGGQISAKDSDYASYAGAYVNDALLMAKIDFLLRTDLISNNRVKVKLKNIRYYLDLKRKAYFCSIGSDIFSKLAFIQGDTRKIAKWK